MNPLVEFNAFDLQEIILHSERINCVKKFMHVGSKKYDTTKGEFELTLLGNMGEFAVARYFDVPMQHDLYLKGDNGVDLVINEWQCHIKATTYNGRNPHFFVDNMSCFTAPIGIGTRILSPTKVEITGIISRPTFGAIAVTKDWGHGDRLAVPENSLLHIDRLLTRLQVV